MRYLTKLKTIKYRGYEIKHNNKCYTVKIDDKIRFFACGNTDWQIKRCKQEIDEYIKENETRNN